MSKVADARALDQKIQNGIRQLEVMGRKTLEQVGESGWREYIELSQEVLKDMAERHGVRGDHP